MESPTEVPTPVAIRPTDDELDMFGLTHPGLKRKSNQDHFLLATVHAQISVHGSSLGDPDLLPLRSNRLGTILLVADGVGGTSDGGTAAQLATETVMQYVTSSLRCYHEIGRGNDPEFLASLREAAFVAHEAVLAEAASRSDRSSLATTLTLGIVVWPWLYVVQVGDSRAYIYTHGQLHQVTRDQTMAQEMLDVGVLNADDAKRSPLKDILSSAIGAPDAVPVVTRADVSERGCILVFCTDGLTKHLSNDEIAAMCGQGLPAEELGRKMVDLALERGGSDNITIIIAQAPVSKRTAAA
ncbi:MAG: protein phosphatase 2C domain-containing protein [Gemmatimonadota bacterium]|nr:protein phosphatase 2C domain-containing protein [Gemmatimonadota bacterium]